MNIKKTALLTAVVSVFFALGNLSAQAVNFTENEKGVKTWTFEVNEGDSKDRTFTGGTYYAKDNYYTTAPVDLSDYLTLNVITDTNTLESVNSKMLQLRRDRSSNSSTLTWTAPQDGTISVKTFYALAIYVNETQKTASNEDSETVTLSATVKKGDVVKMVAAARYGGIKQLTFTPDTYSAAYQFTKNASELQSGVIKVTSTAGVKKIEMDNLLPQITGNTDVVFGLIIDNIPNSADVTGAEILK